MKKYPKYKSSGIAWLGEIPEHWEVTRLKFLGDAIIGLTYSPSEMVDKGEGTLVLRSSNVQNGKITYDSCVYVSTEIPEKKRTKEGDILICSRNGSLHLVGKNALIDKKASNETFGAFMTIIRSAYFHYLHYFFNSSIFKAQSSLFFTSTINQLTTGVLNQIIIPIPKNIEEQTAIANFLDHKLEKIERFISKKKALIKLLNEQKAAIINQAVTKGLNPNGKTKPSGIEWLGDIPEHWEYGKLKHLCNKIGDGIHSTPTYNSNGKIPFINGNNLISKKITITDRTSFVDEDEYYKHKINLKSGALLISINGTIGNLAFYTGEKVVFGKSAAYIELIERSYNKYLFYLLSTDFASKYFISTFQGTTINNLSLSAIRNMTVLIPTVKEQQQIIQYIETETAKIAKTIATIEKEIKLVEEYKTALIAAAVTGKIDVRDFNNKRN